MTTKIVLQLVWGFLFGCVTYNVGYLMGSENQTKYMVKILWKVCPEQMQNIVDELGVWVESNKEKKG